MTSRIRRLDAPWRLDDDGEGETDQAAGKGPQSQAEGLGDWLPKSLWGIDRSVGSPIDFTGTPLTEKVLEEAAELVRNSGFEPHAHDDIYLVKGATITTDAFKEMCKVLDDQPGFIDEFYRQLISPRKT